MFKVIYLLDSTGTRQHIIAFDKDYKDEYDVKERAIEIIESTLNDDDNYKIVAITMDDKVI